jgi:hypothetical protein
VFGSAKRELQSAAGAYFADATEAEQFVDRFAEVYAREHRNRQNRYSAPVFVEAWASEPSSEPFIAAWRAMCDNALRHQNALLVLTTFERKFDSKFSAGFPNTFLVKQWRSHLRQRHEKGETPDRIEVANNLFRLYEREFGLPSSVPPAPPPGLTETDPLVVAWREFWAATEPLPSAMMMSMTPLTVRYGEVSTEWPLKEAVDQWRRAEPGTDAKSFVLDFINGETDRYLAVRRSS